MSNLDIWAKSEPFHPLLYHMIDAGNVAIALLSTKTFNPVVEKFAGATSCPEEGCKAWLAYLVALHDIGKCDPDFQAMSGEELIKPLKEMGLKFRDHDVSRFYHEAQSCEFLRDYLPEVHGWDISSANTAAECALGHHCRFVNPSVVLDDFDGRTGGCWKKLRYELAVQIRSVFAPPDWASEGFPHHSNACMLLLGMTVLSDWIASNTMLMPVHNGEMDLDSYASLSYAGAKKAVSSLGFDDAIDWETRTGFKDVWRSDVIRDMRPVQVECEEVMASSPSPGLVIIEAPMGEGKTEAAIYLATRFMSSDSINGLYVALPTAATSNQMYDRVVSFLSGYDNKLSKKARLVHATSWMIDDATPDCTFSTIPDDVELARAAYEWFTPKKRGLLSPYAVGTVDQAMMSVLNVKFGFLRMLGLSGKVLIIDEVHAYDAYMTSIIERLLQWCSSLKVPVILLSATLPDAKRMSFLSAYIGKECNPGSVKKSYPLITVADSDGAIKEYPVEGSSTQKQVELHLHHGFLHNPELIARLAVDRVSNGGCLCVIANTVGSAQRIYKAIERAVKPGDCELILFHARYRVTRRQEIEESVLDRYDKNSIPTEKSPATKTRPLKAILVATQVVEQSLDLDFDEMISEIAPIDLLLQRIGRLHRHERGSRPTGDTPRLHVLLPPAGSSDFGKIKRVYSQYILLLTLRALDRPYISIPGDIPALVESVYSDAPMPGEFEDEIADARDEWESDIEDETALSGRYVISHPDPSSVFIDNMGMKFAFGDEEGDASTYFNARTRMGDDSSPVIILEGDAYADVMAQNKYPGKGVVKSIMGNQASLPRWWFKGVDAVNGHLPIQKAPAWLPGASVLRMKGGFWAGKSARGTIVIIRDDPVLGIIREEKENDNGIV
jgi:CRISPR-associated endonuclease/helicase Cas3